MLPPCSFGSRDTPVTAMRRQARKSVAASLMVLMIVSSSVPREDRVQHRTGSRAHLHPLAAGTSRAARTGVRCETPVSDGIPLRGMVVAVDMTEQTTLAPGYADSKQDHLKRLRRIEGQVRGIARMV